MELLDLNDTPEDPKPKCIVRLTRSSWANPRQVNSVIRLTYLKRRCSGLNILQDDIRNIGSEEVLQRIVNLSDCADGVYEVVTCNEHRDYESGYIDDYDYRLITYQEEGG